MKVTNTRYNMRISIFNRTMKVLFLLSIVSVSACSSTIEQLDQSPSDNLVPDKSFTFKDSGSNWKVDFNEDEEISALYKDGVKIQDDEIEQHKKMIYKNLDELNQRYNALKGNVHKFYFDADKFEKDVQKFKEDFDKDKFFHFKLDFDEEEFQMNMEKLEEQLKNLKDKKIELYFDSEEFKENIKELEENLKNLPEAPIPPDFDIDIHMDMDQFKEGMKKFGEAFRNFDIKIDSSEFDISELKSSMKELQKNLKGMKIDLKDIKGEVKNLNQFLDELKSELVKDGYVKSKEEEYELEIDKDKTLINGVPVSNDHHKKYLELYKRHFDKDIDGTIKIKRD